MEDGPAGSYWLRGWRQDNKPAAEKYCQIEGISLQLTNICIRKFKQMNCSLELLTSPRTEAWN